MAIRAGEAMFEVGFQPARTGGAGGGGGIAAIGAGAAGGAAVLFAGVVAAARRTVAVIQRVFATASKLTMSLIKEAAEAGQKGDERFEALSKAFTRLQAVAKDLRLQFVQLFGTEIVAAITRIANAMQGTINALQAMGGEIRKRTAEFLEMIPGAEIVSTAADEILRALEGGKLKLAFDMLASSIEEAILRGWIKGVEAIRGAAPQSIRGRALEALTGISLGDLNRQLEANRKEQVALTARIRDESTDIPGPAADQRRIREVIEPGGQPGSGLPGAINFGSNKRWLVSIREGVKQGIAGIPEAIKPVSEGLKKLEEEFGAGRLNGLTIETQGRLLAEERRKELAEQAKKLAEEQAKRQTFGDASMSGVAGFFRGGMQRTLLDNAKKQTELQEEIAQNTREGNTF